MVIQTVTVMIMGGCKRHQSLKFKGLMICTLHEKIYLDDIIDTSINDNENKMHSSSYVDKAPLIVAAPL